MIVVEETVVFNDQGYMQFIEKFAEFLLPKNSMGLVELEALSKDLNVKIFISKGCSVIETWNYEYCDPVLVSLRVSSENPAVVEYLLMRNEEVDCSIGPNLGQNLSFFNGLLKPLGNLIQEYPLSANTKNWAKKLLEKEPEAGKKWEILTQINRSLVKISLIKELKTSSNSIVKLNLYSGLLINQPLFIKKFIESIKPDFNKMIKDILEKKIKVVIPEEIKNNSPEESKRSNVAQSNPSSNMSQKALPSVPEKKKAHCPTCESSPLDDDINKLACKCKLSFDCLSSSLLSRACVLCNTPISDSLFNEMSIYFS